MARSVMRYFISLWAVLLTSCTVNVNVYDHREPSKRPAPHRTDSTSTHKRYAELYFATTPALATIRLISDGSNNLIDKRLGTTPLTIRLSPGVTEPFSDATCGKTIIVLFELEGHKTEKAAQKISCFGTELASEASANEIRGSLVPVR